MQNSQATNANQLDTYIPLTKWNAHFDYPTQGTLRALVFNSDKNGFKKVIRRVNSRIYLGVNAYHSWLNEYGQK